MIFKANNTEEQRHQIKQMQFRVLPKGLNNSRERPEELWSIQSLLSALGEAHLINFPLQLLHQDRPDFVLNTMNTKCGIEVTEAVPSYWAKIVAMRNRNTPNEPLLLRKQGWDGDEPEREWADAMINTLTSKDKIAHKPEFGKYSENWLLIYSNLPLPMVDLSQASDFFAEKIATLWNSLFFSRVFIEHGNTMVCASRERVEHFSIPDYLIQDRQLNKL